MGQHLTPTCDVCGTEKNFRRGIGSFCPNLNCGGTATPESLHDDTPPAEGKYAKVTAASVKVVMEENLRKQPMLDKVDVIDVFGVHADGTTKRISHLMVQLRYPKLNRRPGPKRTAFSAMHPDGITLKLATRDGEDIR
jgi:hypothetical protein